MPPSTTKINLTKNVFVALIIIACIAGIYVFTNQSTPSLSNQVNNNQNNESNINMSEKVITLHGDSYKVGFTFPADPNADHTSESYEWVTKGETLENWKTLITTHKLSSLESNVALSPETYAQNVAALQKSNGASFIETSLINTKDAAEAGIDISNPPYLLIYFFPPSTSSGMAEYNIQKIEGADGGKVTSFIYAEKIPSTELSNFLTSPSYLTKRTAVLLQKFPY